MGPPLLMTPPIHRNRKLESCAADIALGTVWAYASKNPLLGFAVACLWE